jgi:hypothetical protein
MIKDIKQQIKDFKTPIILNSGAFFDHYGTLRRVDSYKDDKFFLSPNDENYIFWQLATQRLPYFVANIDLGTKDFMPYGLGEINYYQAWITRLKFQEWANESNLSIDINNIVESVAKYGSGVWKKYRNKGKTDLKKCNLNRLYFDTSVEYINDSDIIEEHELTESKIRERYTEQADEVIANAEKTEAGNKYIIYEKHGFIDGTRKHVIVAGKTDDDEVVLMDKEQSKDIYFDYHLWNYSGDRWLRVGVYERLFPLQERINTLVNQNAETTEIASLLLLKTGSETVTGNVLRGSESGDILNDPDLQQIPIDNRFLNNFVTELREIEAKADKLCMTPEVITGDPLPSGITFRGQAQLANAGKSPFRYAKELIGEAMGKCIEDNIFPDVVKEWNKGGFIEIQNDIEDIKIYDEIREKKTIAKALEKNPNADVEAMLVDIRQRVKRMNRPVKIEEDFFKFGVGIRLNVTGEKQDKSQQNDAFSNIIQWIMSNPAVGNNPYFRQYAENNGITPIRMGREEIAQVQRGSTGQTVEQPKKDALMSQIDTE